jgi:hypothetical protein
MRQGLVTRDWNHALDFGSLFHDVLDQIYSKKLSMGISSKITSFVPLVKPAAQEYYNKVHPTLDPGDYNEFELMWSTCILLLEKYFTFYQEEDKNLDFRGVEQVFKFYFELNSGVKIPLRGKIDGYTFQENGIWLFETKTKESIQQSGLFSFQAIVEKMEYELQVMIYSQAIYDLYGKYPTGVIYNLVKRPGQIFSGRFNKKSESIEQYLGRVSCDIDKKTDYKNKKSEYFLRYRIPLISSNIKKFIYQDLNQIVENIYRLTESFDPGFRNSANCSMYRHPCEYLEICYANNKHRFIKKTSCFPELAVVNTKVVYPEK